MVRLQIFIATFNKKDDIFIEICYTETDKRLFRK